MADKLIDMQKQEFEFKKAADSALWHFKKFLKRVELLESKVHEL